MPTRTVKSGLGYFLLSLLIILPFLVTTTSGQSTASNQSKEAVVLEFEKPIEREISSGEKHVYRVN